MVSLYEASKNGTFLLIENIIMNKNQCEIFVQIHTRLSRNGLILGEQPCICIVFPEP